jgi:hypothetical protein
LRDQKRNEIVTLPTNGAHHRNIDQPAATLMLRQEHIDKIDKPVRLLEALKKEVLGEREMLQNRYKSVTASSH